MVKRYGSLKMAEYEKMYAILCAAIDQVIEPLRRIPLAWSSAEILQSALWQAEEIYLNEPEMETEE